MQYVISIIPPQNTSLPGALALLTSKSSSSSGWSGGTRTFALKQLEWIHDVGPGLIPRLASCLQFLCPEELQGMRDGYGREIIDWRDQGESDIKILVCSNFWTSAAQKLGEHGINVDSFVTIKPGPAEYSGGMRSSVGRLFLMDSLRDAMPKLSLNVPEERLGDYPNVVPASEVRSALREVAARARTIDEETGAAGIDRSEVLLLAIAMGVADINRHGSGGWSGESPNARYLR